VLNLHNKLQVMLIETKHSCENIKVRHFGKKNTAKTPHFGKITVSLISVFP